MNTKARTLVIAALFVTALCAAKVEVRGQSPSSSPVAAASPAAAEAKAAAKEDAAATVPAPEPDIWHQEELTGDWGGTRSRWKEKGFEMEYKLTQFYQGVASGGLRRSSEYNGVFQTEFKFDLGKLAGWKYWSAEIQTQTRFGGPPVGGTGAINFVNTAAVIPGSDNTVFSVTAANVTRIFPLDLKKGDMIVVGVGRYNLLDVLDEDFFAGSGKERFFNVANIGPLTVLRQVPLITNAATFAYVRNGEPFITFAAMDPNDYSVEPGVDKLLKDGITLSPGLDLPAKYFGKTAKHSFGFAITTKKYTPFDIIRQIAIPGPPVNPVEPKRGSWSVNYAFRQYLVERGKRDGWGLYTQLSFADKDTSPITSFFNLGLGGNGLFRQRPRDEFGLAYEYTNLSKVLKDNLDFIGLGGRLQAEHGVEAFYNLHLTPWLKLTGDLQVIRPVRRTADTAVIPGMRLEVIF